LKIENFQFQRIIEDLVEFSKKATSETNGNDQFSMMKLCREHDSCQMILIMLTFIIDSTPTSQIYTFWKGFAHVVGNCPYIFN
jgi:hypothetical protein